MTDNTTPYPELPPPTKTEQRLYSAAESFWDAASMRAYVDADRKARAGDAELDNPLVLMRELLAHIDDVLSDVEFEKIDTAKWNAVSSLTAILPQAPERASTAKSICTDCRNADSWGFPAHSFCGTCRAGSLWQPLNDDSVNPNTPALTTPAAAVESVRPLLEGWQSGMEPIYAAPQAPERAPQAVPVAWGSDRTIDGDDGAPIGMDEPELAWGRSPPEDSGWWPLFSHPSAQQPTTRGGDPAEPRDDSDRSYDRPVGYLPARELGRLHSGHDANLRSAKFGPSALDGDVPVYLQPAPERGQAAKGLHQAINDITTVLRVEGLDLEVGSRKLLKEARSAIEAALAASREGGAK